MAEYCSEECRKVGSVCDFCKFYNFNGDERGVYTGDGKCEHTEHPRHEEPDSGCDDFVCRGLK
jgi:hypothetical protein